jgi:hypothetical protein
MELQGEYSSTMRCMNTVRLDKAVFCLFFCLALNGCGMPTKSPVKSSSATQAVLSIVSQTSEPNTRSLAADCDSPSVGAPTDAPDHSRSGTVVAPPGLVDHTGGEYPPGLLVEAIDTLEGCPQDILLFRDRWLPVREFLVITDQGERGLFIEKDGCYIHLNSGAELTGINVVLRGFRFTRQDFDKPSAVSKFLTVVMLSYKGSTRAPCTTFAVDGLVRDPSEWLKETKQTEASLRELCRDPVFTFDGDKWSVTCSAFRPDGGVDQWKFVGRHDAQANVNRILRIDVSDKMPPGTFHYPFYDYD